MRLRDRLTRWLRGPRTVTDPRRALVAEWATDVAAGPIRPGALTRFSTGEPQHEHGAASAGVCGPGGDGAASCFTQRPYGAERGCDEC